METGGYMGLRNGQSLLFAKVPAKAHAVAKANGTSQHTLKASAKTTFSVASFFSGIGGFDLGFQQAGIKVNYQCEINPFCKSILENNWAKVIRDENIKKITAESAIPISDVWVGGFPCQDVSLARMGPRLGLKGAQSGLFHEFSRLVQRHLPKVLVIENVPGLLSSHGGRDFQIVIRTLAGFGYCVGWRMLNSKDFGLPQFRQRIFIVGCYRENRGPAEILFEPQRGQRDHSESRSNETPTLSPFKTSVGDTVKGPLVKSLAHCLYACSARHTGTDWSRNYVSYPDGRVRRLTPVECERLQGFPDGWTIPHSSHEKFGDADDLDSLRYHAIGNAVSVPVAKWLGSRVKKYLKKLPTQQ